MFTFNVFSGESTEVKDSCDKILREGSKLWNGHSKVDDVSDEQFDRDMRMFMDNGAFCGLITAVYNNRVVGLILTAINPEISDKELHMHRRPCWIKWLIVDRSMRGQGVGSKLLLKAEEWFARYDTKITSSESRRNIYVMSVPDSTKFYEINGYQVIGTKDLKKFDESYFYGESGHVYMAKSLIKGEDLDRETPLIEKDIDQKLIDINLPMSFGMKCFPNLPQTGFASWWDNVFEYTCLVGNVISCSILYNDDDFDIICSKFEQCIIRDKPETIYKGHSDECRDIVTKNSKVCFENLSTRKRSIVERFLKAIDEATIEIE